MTIDEDLIYYKYQFEMARQQVLKWKLLSFGGHSYERLKQELTDEYDRIDKRTDEVAKENRYLNEQVAKLRMARFGLMPDE